MIPIPVEQFHCPSSQMMEESYASSCPLGISQSPSPSPIQSLGHSYQSGMSECKMSECRPRSRSRTGKLDFVKRKSQRNRFTMEEEDFVQFYEHVVPNSPHQDIDSALPSDHMKRSIKYITIDIFRQCVLRKLKYTVVDCRYPYEHKGGHVKNAKNLWNDTLLFNEFPVTDRTKISNEILIFYCEFSGGRAPEMANKLRNADKMWSNGGDLIYKNIFIIDKGYVLIHKQIPEECTGTYISMNAEGYESLYNHYVNEATSCKIILTKKRPISLAHSYSLGSISYANFTCGN